MKFSIVMPEENRSWQRTKGITLKDEEKGKEYEIKKKNFKCYACGTFVY